MKNKLSRILLVLCIATLYVTGTSAQKKEDVIYLSNGSIIHGKIISDSSSSAIRIINHSGDTWAFDRVDVDSVKQEKRFDYTAQMFNRRRIAYGISADLMARSGNNSIGKAVIPGVRIGAAYCFNPYLSAGAETGMLFFDYMEVPVSANVRLRLKDTPFSPFVYLSAGHTFPAEKRPDDWEYKYESKGGVNSGIGIGLEKIMSENTSFIFLLTYSYQELGYHLVPLYQWAQERDRTEIYSRIGFKFGFNFK